MGNSPEPSPLNDMSHTYPVQYSRPFCLHSDILLLCFSSLLESSIYFLCQYYRIFLYPLSFSSILSPYSYMLPIFLPFSPNLRSLPFLLLPSYILLFSSTCSLSMHTRLEWVLGRAHTSTMLNNLGFASTDRHDLDPDLNRNRTGLFLSAIQLILVHQVSSESVHNFLRYPANKQTDRGENITSFHLW